MSNYVFMFPREKDGHPYPVIVPQKEHRASRFMEHLQNLECSHEFAKGALAQFRKMDDDEQLRLCQAPLEEVATLLVADKLDEIWA